jgi:hypothetical protein
MDKYRVRQNYVIFEKIGEDSLGFNERAAELKDQKADTHYFLTSVYPYLSNNHEIWGRIKILLEGIKRSNITNLYSPDKIIKDKNDIFLVYEHKNIKNMEQILADAAKNNVLVSFDLAFSTVLSIADLIDTGASIVVSGKKSFHGMLTPDNIFIDCDGKIFLKNYGIHQYLKSDEIYAEMIKKYGTWLTPEFLRKEKIVNQSDIYHLGYIIFRVLTGKYFSLNQGEDINRKLSNITFDCQLPSNDKELISKIIVFFKKTLNPNPELRFSNIKEFKDFISSNFHIEELSSITFNLAYFMNSVYKDQVEKEEELFKKELQYEVPKEEKKTFLEQKKTDDHLVEDILSGLEKESSRAKKPIIIGLFTIIALIIIGILIIPSLTGNKKELEEQNAKITRLLAESKQNEKKLQKLQRQTIKTKADEIKRQEELVKLKEKNRLTEIRLAEAKKNQEALDRENKNKLEKDQLKEQYDSLIKSVEVKISENNFEQAASDLNTAKLLDIEQDVTLITNLEKNLQEKKTAYEEKIKEQKQLEEKKRLEDAEQNRRSKPENSSIKNISQFNQSKLKEKMLNLPVMLEKNTEGKLSILELTC